uniref:2Fe-2S ferredoxin-type domain-containing protein n=1 Tax=Hyaloperonospora arabidopsidis (strain Emoy2) TaxID=559515 RepID=M4BPP7_HYAAE
MRVAVFDQWHNVFMNELGALILSLFCSFIPLSPTIQPQPPHNTILTLETRTIQNPVLINRFMLAISTLLRRATRRPALRFSTRPTQRSTIAPVSSVFYRSFAQVTFTFVDGEGASTTVTADESQSLLDVAHEHDVELEGACGGELACSTCHLVFEKRIFDELPVMSEEEEDMLDLAWGLTDTSRLGCQIKVTRAMEGMTVQIPEETDNLM